MPTIRLSDMFANNRDWKGYSETALLVFILGIRVKNICCCTCRRARRENKRIKSIAKYADRTAHLRRRFLWRDDILKELERLRDQFL